MKKLFILILACVLTLSIFLVSGCGTTPEQAETSNSVTESSTVEESSSSARPSRNLGSKEDTITPSTVNSNITSTQNSDETTNSSSVSDIVINGEIVTIPETDATNASPNAAMIILTINNIESVSPDNFREKIELIQACETEYNKLTPAEKAEVTNYSHLLEAKKACDKFLSQEKVQLFLKDYAKLEAITTLTKLDVELVANLRSTYNGFSQEELSQIENYSAKQQKIEQSYNTLKSQGLMEFSVIIDNLSNLSQSTFFTFNGSIDVEDLGQDKVQVNGSYPSKGAKIVQGTSVTFTTAITGTLKVYSYRTDKLTLTFPDGSSTLGDVDTTPGDDYTIRTYAVNSQGEYKLDLIEGEVFILAIVLQA